MNELKIRWRLFVPLVLAVFLTGGPALSAPPEDNFSLETHQTVLDNGLTVLVTEMPGHGLVSLYALVKVGSAMEGKFLGAGITHFVEHMLFKGTEKRAVGQIAGEVQSLGGTINASTSFDYTIFTLTVPSEHFAEALDILSDMILHPRLDPDEVKREQQVITKEIRLHKDNPDYYLSELVFKTDYLRHPYRVPIIGHEDVFLKISRADLAEYYRTFYIPNNIVVSIAGDVEREKVLPLVRDAFQSAPRGVTVLRNLPPEPDPIIPRWHEEEYPTELIRMSVTYPGVNLLDRDMFPLDVLAMVLGQGQSSRLYRDLLIDKKLVQSVTASNFTPVDRGLFEVECLLDKDNTREVADAITAHIEKIKKEGLRPDELEKARRQVVSRYISEHQTTADVAYQSAMDMAFVGDPDFSQKYIGAVRKVTNEDIKRVARKHLTETGRSVVILRPRSKKGATEGAARETVKTGDIEEVPLKNGLTVLFKKDPAVPLVFINLVMNGGVSQEDPARNGLSNLTAMTWDKGTNSLSRETIAAQVESRGASLGGFSGQNSLGLSMQVLPEDLDFAVTLVLDLVQHPVFPEVDVEKDKEMVRAGILERNDSIFDVASMALHEGLFPGYPLGLTDLGTQETVSKLTRREVVDFYRKLAVPGNMVLAVFGDFDDSDRDKIVHRFSRLKTGRVDLEKTVPAPLDGPVEKTVRMDKKQTVVMFGFRGVGLNDPDRYGLQVLASILGSSFQGRIFQKVREEFGQSYTLGGYFRPSLETGTLLFYVTTTAQYAQKVKGMLEDIFRDIAENPVPESELNDAKTYLKGRHQRAVETAGSLGFRAALDTLYGLGADDYKRYNGAIDKVTADDIKRLAGTYLDLSRDTVIIAGPSREIP